ncbi:related to 26S proteasome subunit YTA7 [Lecanosticta acicola]|uniref:Related to 26S proteasome subunit YTA7 n=1 Tax=Lecanosticta acicola TaxID=111012 RepID=A0AAI8Z3A3_9PEZI|nr:related to 26S proteasome subunit YTA7 [Lecanosticta acicola]
MAGRGYKRKLEDFDPNKSDSDDLDYGAEESAPRARPSGRSRKSNKSSPKKPSKRRRERYNDSDIEPDSGAEDSVEEDSFAESSAEEEPVERNPRTGRGVRSAAKKPVKYEESDEEEEILDSESDGDELQPRPVKNRRTGRVAPEKSLVVKLKVPTLAMNHARPSRTRAGSRGLKREPTPQAVGAAGSRRSSRLSHDEQRDLVALTDSGKHEVITRAGTSTPEPEGSGRPTRSSKGLKKPPSVVFEASQEGSFVDPEGIQQTAEGEEFFSQLQQAAGTDDPAKQISPTSPASEGQDEDIRMSYEEEEAVVQESQPDPEDVEEDEEPISKGGRTLRGRRKSSTPPASQPINKGRSLRNRKTVAEQSSDFEPDAEGDADAEGDMSDSDDDHLKPPRGRSSAEASSQSGRRSGRPTRKTASQRSRSRRSPDEDDELDREEIADEAADLEEDNRRNRRPRRRPPRQEARITFEPNLRSRGNRPDYRILRPELAFPVDDDDAPTAVAITPQRTRRGGGSSHAYRSLFSTFGPFGGAGGPPPVLGGPDGAGATGGVDSDSSDEETSGRNGQQVGGGVGMTPTSAFPKPYAPQALNSDPIQGPSGGAPGLGKIKDKRALADADPLGVDPNVSFDGVGGLDNHINQLKEMVTLPLLYPEVFQQFHVTPPRGVLFHGPPGTGKTLLARALASSVSSQGQKVTFYMRKGADALSKWVGEAEKQLRLLFEEARKNQPSIIFFDEIDGLAPVRSSKQEQIHASIVATLLALMDGMDGRGQVIVIGATNRPDSVDPALRRPGRFDREFYFPLPDQNARRKILDIHTKGWDPPLKPQFKEQLAELTRGYGGADLRALCTEAALNAVQGTYPQIYSSDKKLLIDPSQIKVLAKDFMLSVNKIVPSSERSASSGAAPLKKEIEPLLRKALTEITSRLDQAIPRKRKATALEEAMYDDRDDELGFEKENMERNFEASRIFRPRLLIRGFEGMGQQYLGAALLSKFEGLHVQNFDLATLMKDSTRSTEAAIVQLFEEVKRHKPSVIYIPNVNVWYDTLTDSTKRTFVGLLRSLSPTEPVLLLGIMEDRSNPDKDMLHDLFGYSKKNQYLLVRPEADARTEFFKAVIEFIRLAPAEFPASTRKKRKLADLPVAPPPPEPEGPSKAELKAQKKKDHQTLNHLKLHIQKVMDQIKLKYRSFRTPPVDDATIAYLFDEEDPRVLTTDLTEEQREQQHLFRPYEKDKDRRGVPGLREVASGKFYYNLEIVTIEKRLSNGYYKRPKDFTADIRRLSKDAHTLGDTNRVMKANEMLTNVEVDMNDLESQQPALAAECQAVYEREKQRALRQAEKAREAQDRGEEVPKVVPNVPFVQTSKTTTESSGPVMLGQEVPGKLMFPITPNQLGGPSPDSNHWSTTQTNGSHPSNHTNGSNGPSHAQEDSEMFDHQDDTHDGSPEHSGFSQSLSQSQPASQPASQGPSQGFFSQRSAHSTQPDQYQNSDSTTNSDHKSSDRSSGGFSGNDGSSGDTHSSNGIGPPGHPDFSSMAAPRGGSQLPSTQEPSVAGSQPNSSGSQLFDDSPNSQRTAPPHRQSLRTSNIMGLLNNDEDDEEEEMTKSKEPYLIVDEIKLGELHGELVSRSSGLSLEQLEQVNAALMDVVWRTKDNWNRNQVWAKVQEAFNETVEDIESCQGVMGPSQEES